ncbi:MAG: SMP-30/gluconolactonase/LRE family protein [Candidatus Zixiibacteriota bacterium]|nr:MAG: SMP-30/gluconolactonase/LRE family protein [candidate division Zixibacteria bacterium]
MLGRLTVGVLILSAGIPSAQNLLNQPESVVFDAARERYLVSNFGDGSIVQIDSTGVQSNLNTDLSQVAGLHIVGDTLYAASSDGPHAGLVGIDLLSGSIIFELAIDGMDFLNDITSDSSGYVYVTEHNGNKIFKVKRDNLTYSSFVSSGLSYPNGIMFDSINNRLLITNVCATAGRIEAVSLEDSTVTTLVAIGLTGTDGLAEDSEGYIYVSSWQSNAVYRYHPSFSEPRETISTGHSAPADIYFNRRDNVLAIPNFYANEVTFLQFADVDGDGVIDINDNCPDDYNPDQADSDEDGFPDSCDNCPDVYNPGQSDVNLDGIGDSCCCIGLTGNVDDDSGDITDIGDLTALIGYLFIPPNTPPVCMKEANINGDEGGVIDIGDLTALISYLFIPPNPEVAEC